MADSIRDALTSAYAEVEAKSPEPIDQSAPAAAPVADETPTASVQASGDDKGSEGTTPAVAAKDAPKVTTDAPKASGDPKAPSAAPQATQSAPSDPAPGSWKPAEKALWTQLPPAAREAIKRRESEMQRVVSHSQAARQFQSEYQEVLNVFQPLLDARGVKDPLREVIRPVLGIRAVLETGTPDQKAQMLANIVRDFQVDVLKLDEALTAPRGPQVPTSHAPAPSFDPRGVPEFAPLYHIAEMLQQRTVAKAAEQVATVESQPHYEDLREDMADLMETWAERGRTMSVQEAYQRALALRPDLAPAPVAPQAIGSVSEAAAMLARSRKAASSVSGAPQTGVGKKPTTLRDQIAAAMDATNGR